MLFAVISGFLLAPAAPLAKHLLGERAGWLLAALPVALFAYFWSFLEPVANGQKFVFSAPWLPAFDINLSFYVDGLSLLFALLITGIGALILVYAGGYLKGHVQQGRFFSFLMMFMASMLGLVLADNLITLFVFWELTSITSFLLIGFDHTRQAARRAAIQALVVTGAGGLSLLAGVILIAQVSGTMELSELLARGNVVKDHPYYLPIMILVLGGAFTKSAQVPLHSWLPNAMEAPTPVSAYLHSATMVKAGVYLVMRMTPVLGDTVIWSITLASFGGATLIAGTFLAIRQTDLKLMLAYTTVASLGLLVMLTGIGTEKAILGAVIYLIAHSLFKGALFMVAGVIDHGTGTRDVTKVGGLRSAMPITAIAAGLAALSMAGIPPFFGFLSKEVMYAAFAKGDIAMGVAALVAIIGNALMLVIAAAVAIRPFFGARPETPKPPHEGSIMLVLGPLVLATLGLLAGLFAHGLGVAIVQPTASAVYGFRVEADLHLWAGFNLAVTLSIITIAAGLIVFVFYDRARGAMVGLFDAIGWGPDRGFDQLINGLTVFASTVTERLQPGVLKQYMMVTFVVATAAILVPMALGGLWPDLPEWPTLYLYEWAVLGLVVIGIIAVLAAPTRLIAIVSLGIQGFAVALVFLEFGAPDLSFTQFMVETLSVVILALVLTRLRLDPRDARRPRERVFDVGISVLAGVGFGLVLLRVVQGTLDMRLTEFFIANSTPVAHGRNIVNVILVDFRAIDTLGEIAVVMCAGVAVLALVRLRPPRIGSDTASGGARS